MTDLLPYNPPEATDEAWAETSRGGKPTTEVVGNLHEHSIHRQLAFLRAPSLRLERLDAIRELSVVATYRLRALPELSIVDLETVPLAEKVQEPNSGVEVRSRRVDRRDDRPEGWQPTVQAPIRELAGNAVEDAATKRFELGFLEPPLTVLGRRDEEDRVFVGAVGERNPCRRAISSSRLEATRFSTASANAAAAHTGTTTSLTSTQIS